MLLLLGCLSAAFGCVDGVWISPDRIAGLATSGLAWEEVLEDAEKDTSNPQLGVLGDDVDVYTYAKALVSVRLAGASELVRFRGDDVPGWAVSELLEDEILETLELVVSTESEKCAAGSVVPGGEICSGEVLSLSRNLPGYLIAADLLDIAGPLKSDLVAWLDPLRCTFLPVNAIPDDQHTLLSTHEHRPNNWGTSAGFARAIAMLYLDRHARFRPSACKHEDGRPDDLLRVNRIFEAWMGVPGASHDEFNWNNNVSWQADEAQPRALNPAGAQKLCQATGEWLDVDGVLPEEMRRIDLPYPSGDFQDYCAEWPPPCENYVFGALQGALPQAVVLSRVGFLSSFQLADQGLRRALEWTYHEQGCAAVGDDNWIPHLANWHYPGLRLPVQIPSSTGKAMGYTDWTHPCQPGTCGPVLP